MKHREESANNRFKTLGGVLAASFGKGRRCEHAHIAVKVRLEEASRRPLRILRRSAAPPRQASKQSVAAQPYGRLVGVPALGSSAMDSVAWRLAITYSTTNRGIPSRQCDPFPWACFLGGRPNRHLCTSGSAPLRD